MYMQGATMENEMSGETTRQSKHLRVCAAVVCRCERKKESECAWC